MVAGAGIRVLAGGVGVSAGSGAAGADGPGGRFGVPDGSDYSPSIAPTTFISGIVPEGTTLIGAAVPGLSVTAAVPVGGLLGKYEIRRELGRGGMGAVYLGFDRLIQREVAIKVLTPEFSAAPAAVQRFLGEARSIGRLNHPNVVSIYDIDQWQGMYYLVMELLPGGSVADLAEGTGRVPWRQACRMTAQAARGLSAAHEAGLIHRDIKPANLMTGRDGIVKVVDFGLSKAVHADAALSDGATQAGQILGTPHYMSPEQFEGAGVTAATDIYSLGATLYRLLTGRHPFETAGSIVALMKSHLLDPVPSIQPWAGDAPAECDRLIQKAMQKRAADRFESAARFADALDLLLAGNSAVFSGSVGGVLSKANDRPMRTLLVAERSAMQGRMLASGLKSAGAELVELHGTVAAADARLEGLQPDVVWTAMELDDARGIDWLRRLSRRGSLADRAAVLHSSGLQPKDLQEFSGAACRVVAPKTASADMIVRVLSALGPVRSSLLATSSGGVSDVSCVSLRVFTDTGVLPENLKELLRNLQLMDVRVESLLRIANVPEAEGSLTLVLRTGDPTAGDSAMLAELLCSRQAEPVLVLQSGVAGLLLRGAGCRGVLGVAERTLDSRGLALALQALSGAAK